KYAKKTKQKGKLIEVNDDQNSTEEKLDEMINLVGGFDLIIGGIPWKDLTGSRELGDSRVSRWNFIAEPESGNFENLNLRVSDFQTPESVFPWRRQSGKCAKNSVRLRWIERPGCAWFQLLSSCKNAAGSGSSDLGPQWALGRIISGGLVNHHSRKHQKQHNGRSASQKELLGEL
ncbi:hypothetical protein KI387_027525, partial [Taxus chinensis]